MKIIPGATITYTAKSSEQRTARVLHGVPGQTDTAVLLDGTAGVKVRLIDGQWKQVEK